MTSATETQAKLLDTFVNTAQKNGSAITETIRLNDDQQGETYVSAISMTKEDSLLDLHPLRISESPKSSTDADYFIQNTLGKGGMGIVRLARQNSLGRDVALKELQSQVEHGTASARLVHEAQISGALEHPNIVPVHDLGRTPENKPVLVMKRIDGTSWQEMLHTPEHSAWEAVRDDRMVWNIKVLIDVCNAVDYGHSKNIVHRDIKPENIMIGSFAEVYLLDWSLGYDVTKEPSPIVPEVAGTPAYMAPRCSTD
jgi:eukaryotic-like serine/threonine-protein kinase